MTYIGFGATESLMIAFFVFLFGSKVFVILIIVAEYNRGRKEEKLRKSCFDIKNPNSSHSNGNHKTNGQ
jgi:hypothetical protein